MYGALAAPDEYWMRGKSAKPVESFSTAASEGEAGVVRDAH